MTVSTRELFGLPIAALTMHEAVSLAERAIERRQPMMFGVVNAAKIVNMQRDDELRRAVLASDVILADGASVVIAARLLGRPLPERVAGIDLMIALLERASERGHAVYCLGATAEVLAGVERVVALLYPGARLVGSHHGYYGTADEADVAAAIAAARPDILFVAMTSPRKERFLARWRGALNVPVCHGVGGSFDVLAGKVRRAPPVWRRLGMEWLYRVAQEPGRLWKRYLITNSAFLGMLLVELLRAAPPRIAGVLRRRRTA
ncbi:MAG: WecB/TagA/CpsF family glycosyltransferase [Acidobacteria bacterium]|nr:WecB/TagA/CpsF family glycosyltransferase [Acidobacteriota bacterium]